MDSGLARRLPFRKDSDFPFSLFALSPCTLSVILFAPCCCPSLHLVGLPLAPCWSPSLRLVGLPLAPCWSPPCALLVSLFAPCWSPPCTLLVSLLAPCCFSSLCRILLPGSLLVSFFVACLLFLVTRCFSSLSSLCSSSLFPRFSFFPTSELSVEPGFCPVTKSACRAKLFF